MNLECDVELEAARGGAGHLCLRRGSFRRRGWHAGFICEAFLGMEPCVDFLRWIFTERTSSEGKLLRIMLVEGSVPVAVQVGQFIKFDEISSSHGGHTSVMASLPRSCLDCMRRFGAPCSSAEHLWALEVPVALAKVEGMGPGGSLEVPVVLAKVENRTGQGPL